MRRRGYIVQNGIEYVVNKQDVVKVHERIRKCCRVRGMRIDGRGGHEDKGD
jgi:hypothetical protein